jgi:hypothetical protein
MLAPGNESHCIQWTVIRDLLHRSIAYRLRRGEQAKAASGKRTLEWNAAGKLSGFFEDHHATTGSQPCTKPVQSNAHADPLFEFLLGLRVCRAYERAPVATG